MRIDYMVRAERGCDANDDDVDDNKTIYSLGVSKGFAYAQATCALGSRSGSARKLYLQWSYRDGLKVSFFCK